MISLFPAQFQGLGGDRPKPGECPENEDDDERECPAAEQLSTICLVDGDCNSTAKCCSDGCQMQCVQPANLPPTPQTIIGPKGPPGDKGEPVSYWEIISLIFCLV